MGSDHSLHNTLHIWSFLHDKCSFSSTLHASARFGKSRGSGRLLYHDRLYTDITVQVAELKSIRNESSSIMSGHPVACLMNNTQLFVGWDFCCCHIIAGDSRYRMFLNLRCQVAATKIAQLLVSSDPKYCFAQIIPVAQDQGTSCGVTTRQSVNRW